LFSFPFPSSVRRNSPEPADEELGVSQLRWQRGQSTKRIDRHKVNAPNGDLLNLHPYDLTPCTTPVSAPSSARVVVAFLGEGSSPPSWGDHEQKAGQLGTIGRLLSNCRVPVHRLDSRGSFLAGTSLRRSHLLRSLHHRLSLPRPPLILPSFPASLSMISSSATSHSTGHPVSTPPCLGLAAPPAASQSYRIRSRLSSSPFAAPFAHALPSPALRCSPTETVISLAHTRKELTDSYPALSNA
jgi:hypothetical protein